SPDALQFLSLELGANPLGLTMANFNVGQTGRLLSAWYDPTASGLSLPDSAALFYLKFRVLANTPGMYPVALDLSWYNEIVDLSFTVLVPAFQAGGAQVGAVPASPLQLNDFCSTPATSCSNPNGAVTGILSGGEPPYTVVWTGPNGFSATTTDLAINNLHPGAYSALVTDAAGATLLVQADLLAGRIPIQVASAVVPASCGQNDGCIRLTATSWALPISYAWSDTSLSGQNVCDLSPGVYTVTATDAAGCSHTESYTVAAGSSLFLDILSSPANCANNQLGTALAVPQNGQPPYWYTWSTADDTPLITGLFSGAYAVTVTDQTGCSGVAVIFIPDATIADWALSLQPICGSGGLGDLILLTGNPTALEYPVTLTWNNGTTQMVSAPAGDTLGVLTDLPAGLYGLTVADSTGCGQTLDAALACLGPVPADSAALVWPGDADNNNAVNHHDLLYLGMAFGANGPARANASIDWVGQPATDWPQTTGGLSVNFKNMDTNGDGLIDAADTLAIAANWGRVLDPLDDNPFAAATTVPGMAPTPAPELSLPADTLFAGQSVFIPVVLGSPGAPADSLHGLAFSLSYDPKILRAVYFEPLASWFGDPADGLICLQRSFPGQNRLDIAISRTDGLPASGFGIIGRTFIIIEDDIFLREKAEYVESGGGFTGTLSTTLHVRNIRTRTPSNRQLEVRPRFTKLVVAETVGVTPDAHPDKLEIQPNPASALLRISTQEIMLRNVEIWDLYGRLQANFPQLDAHSLEIPVEHWPRGSYLLKAYTERGVLTQKILCH
ncbi:MAG: hypothetical protein JNK89_00455, partial [Saprospiraceae bacterium]|nr:hypothetical protein [Saprospiraceae bacterium]